MSRLSALVFCLLAVATGAWYYKQRSERVFAPTSHIVILLDFSPSMVKSCGSVDAIVRSALQEKTLKLRRDSKLAIIAIGGLSRSLDPQLVFEQKIPVVASGMLSQGAENAREDWYGQIRALCEALPQPEASAIFRGVQIALDWTQAHGCVISTQCRLVLNSDLEEGVNPAVVKWLDGKTGKSDTVPRLNNSSAAVTLCNYVKATNVGAFRADGAVLVERWRGLFMEPVRASPYCEGTAALAANSP